jgi:hypothetical protein
MAVWTAERWGGIEVVLWVVHSAHGSAGGSANRAVVDLVVRREGEKGRSRAGYLESCSAGCLVRLAAAGRTDDMSADLKAFSWAASMAAR